MHTCMLYICINLPQFGFGFGFGFGYFGYFGYFGFGVERVNTSSK